MTNAGGLGILCADACDAAGLELPELAGETRQALAAILPSEASLANPVDLLGSATGETYAQALPHVLRDPGIDAVIALFVPPVVAGADEVASAIREAVEHETSEKPVLAVVVSADGTPQTLREADSPVAAFAYPESAARALGFAARRAEWLRRPTGTVPTIDGIDRATARHLVDTALAASDDVWLDAAAARTLLTAYGVPLVPEQVAADAAGAVAAARALGRPVVLKTAAAGVHKTESGGVALNLETDGRDSRRCRAHRRTPARAADDQRGHRAAGRDRAGPALRPARRLRARRCARRADRRRRIPDRTADRPRCRRARPGWQGGGNSYAASAAPQPPTRLRSSRSSIGCPSSRLDLPEVAELDLNPIIALPSGCVAVDARIRLCARPGDRSLKSW